MRCACKPCPFCCVLSSSMAARRDFLVSGCCGAGCNGGGGALLRVIGSSSSESESVSPYLAMNISFCRSVDSNMYCQCGNKNSAVRRLTR